MKRIVLTVCTLLLIEVSYGQTIIPKLGISIANVNAEYEDDPDLTPIVGFSAGVGFNFLLTETLSLQPELLFIQKGGKVEYSDSYSDAEYAYSYTEKFEDRFNYLELPVMVKMTLGDKKMFYVNAGLSFSYGIGGKEKFNGKYITDNLGDVTTETESYDSKVKFGSMPDNYEGDDTYVDNAFNFGAQVGGGVILFEKVILDVRYGLSFNDNLDDYKSKNMALQFTVGVPISLVK